MRNGRNPHLSHPSKVTETNRDAELFKLNCALTNWASSFDHFVALPSAPEAPRGRFGIFASVTEATRIEHPSELDPLLTQSRSKPAVFLLGYELGRAWLNLPEVVAPRGQPLGLYLTLGECLELDGQDASVTSFGPTTFNAENYQPERQPHEEAVVWEKVRTDQDHSDGIHAVHEAIRRGDIYQANLTRRFRLRGQFDANSLFNELLASNPVGHMAWLKAGETEVLSNTMETLLEYDPETRLASSYPIKGTQPRIEEDRTPPPLDLIPKERAEHVMIVDLIRNDLGRICEPGTVRVPSLLGIEGYRGVWHGVSKVEGKVREDVSSYDMLAALFTGGSITGAPKRKAVEVLAGLEPEPRGFYTGTIGVVWPDGRISASILIRTLVHDNEGWSMNVGGGIVIDSVAERELDEMDEKSAAVKLALRALKSNRRLSD